MSAKIQIKLKSKIDTDPQKHKIKICAKEPSNLIDLKVYHQETQKTPKLIGKQLVIDVLKRLVDHTEAKIKTLSGDERKKQQFRSSQFTKAIENLKECQTDITSGKQAKEIKGIGKGIADRIDEIFKTGTLTELTEKIEIDPSQKIINELMTVTGIGEANAKKFYDAGIVSVEDLKQKAKANLIKITHHMQVGLDYYNDIQLKIPYQEVAEISTSIRQCISKIDPDHNLLIEVCGSHRRQKALSGDIDVLITHQNIQTEEALSQSKELYLKNIVAELKKNGIIVADLTTNGNTKFMGICVHPKVATGRRIDIRFVAYESYYPGLLYFTGSMILNKLMRTIALEKGYTLNEYGLYRFENNHKEQKIIVHSEKDIFDKLGIKYLEPNQRDIGGDPHNPPFDK